MTCPGLPLKNKFVEACDDDDEYDDDEDDGGGGGGGGGVIAKIIDFSSMPCP